MKRFDLDWNTNKVYKDDGEFVDADVAQDLYAELKFAEDRIKDIERHINDKMYGLALDECSRRSTHRKNALAKALGEQQ